jgi:P pilus assembly chaperone PapD
MRAELRDSMGRSLMKAIALSGVMLGGADRLAAQLSVDELELFLRPGNAPRSGVIRVTNSSTQPVQALVEIQDWDRDEAGTNRFHALGTEAHSCKEKLKVFPLALRIDAGATETLRVSYDGAATEACWGVIFIQGNEQRQQANQSQITYVVRTGVKVYVEPAAAKREGDVEGVQIVQQRVAGAADTMAVPHIEVAFKNTGNAHLKPKGAIEIRSADNVSAAKLEITEFPVVPGGLRKVALPLPKLKPGRYVALALLDYGGGDIAAGQFEFEVR